MKGFYNSWVFLKKHQILFTFHHHSEKEKKKGEKGRLDIVLALTRIFLFKHLYAFVSSLAWS